MRWGQCQGLAWRLWTSSRSGDPSVALNPATRARAVEILRQVFIRQGASESDAQAAAEKLLTMQQNLPQWPPPADAEPLEIAEAPE